MKKKIHLKKIMTVDTQGKKIRLFRLIFGQLRMSALDNNGKRNYAGTRVISLGLVPRIFKVSKECLGWSVTFLGIIVKYKRGGGGLFV